MLQQAARTATVARRAARSRRRAAAAGAPRPVRGCALTAWTRLGGSMAPASLGSTTNSARTPLRCRRTCCPRCGSSAAFWSRRLEWGARARARARAGPLLVPFSASVAAPVYISLYTCCVAGDADLVKPRVQETYWLPLGAAPRTPLEALASAVFAAHTSALPVGDARTIDPACSGAEFWVQ